MGDGANKTGASTSTPLPLNASIDISVDLRLPHRGADGRNPVLVDRYTSLQRLGGKFAPRGGPINVQIPLRMTGGVIDLSGDLARFKGLRFFDVAGSCISGDILTDDGGLFRADRLRLTEDGVPQIQGPALTWLFGGVPFQDNLRLVGAQNPYVFPYGFDTNGDLVCSADDKDMVVDHLPLSTHFREDGIPRSLNLSTALVLSGEMNRANAAGGCSLDPNLDLSNVPQWMINDPLMMIRQASIVGNLSVDGRTLTVPAMPGSPAMVINLGEGANSIDINASYNNPELQAIHNGNFNADELAQLRHQRELKAAIQTQFDLVSVKIGDNTIQIPLSGKMDLTAQLKGLFPTRTPENLWVHILLNGVITLNGDIVIPAMDGAPEIRIARSTGTNAISAKAFAITQQNGKIQVNGSLNADFNFDKIQVGKLTAPGPHNFNISVNGDDQAVVMELGGRLTLPRTGYPIPLSVALKSGYLSFEGIRVALEPNISLNRVAGTFGGTIALRDVAGKVDGHRVTANASVTIKNGKFAYKQGTIDADFTLGLDAKGSVNNQGFNVNLQSDVGIHDTGICLVDGSNLTWRHIGMQNISGAIKAKIKDFGIDAPQGSFSDGPITELDGQVLSPGIHMKADVDGVNFGLFATTTVNTQVKGIRVSTPQGTFELTGQLVGTMKFVNISNDPKVPDFKPVVGSIRFELRNGQVAMVTGKGKLNVINGATLEIRDNDKGVLSLIANNNVNMGGAMSQFGLGDIHETLSLPNTVSNSIKISEIQIDPNGIHKHYPAMTPSVFGLTNDPLLKIGPQGINQWHQDEPVDFCPADPSQYGVNPVATYYDPGSIDTINIPSIILRATGGGTTLMSAYGGAKISGLTTDQPEARYHMGTTLNGRRIKLPQGTIKVGSSYLYLSGVNEKVGLSLRPPKSIKVDMKHIQDGVTYHVKGELKPKGRIHASVNLKGQRISIHNPKNPYTLTGKLEVTAKDASGQVVGSGTVAVSSRYRVHGHASTSSAQITIDVPKTVLSGELTSQVTTQGITVNKGARFEIPIEGFKGRITADLSNPSNPKMKSTWNLPSVGSRDKHPEILIPGIQLAGLGDKGTFKDIGVNFHLDPNGQQIQVNASKRNGVSFRTLPGPDGKPRRFELTFAVDEAGNKIKIVGTGSSSASINGVVSPSGIVTLNVQDLRVESNTDGRVKQPVQLDLNKLGTLARLPGLQVEFNPRKNEVRFVIKAPPYNLPKPPQSFRQFFSWSQRDWQAYTAKLNKQTHLLRLTESNVAVMRKGAGYAIPAGRGDILINLKKPLDITLPADGKLMGRLTTEVDKVLDVRRVLPAPPPCSKACPAIVFSDRQDPKGILYFTQTKDSKGTPQIHPDLPELLHKGLGIPRSDVDQFIHDRQISLPRVVQLVRENKGVGAHMSDADVGNLIRSYLTSPVPNGTFRQMGLRSLISLANIQRIGDLVSVKDGRLTVHGHVFRPDAYHSVSKGDGNDMQSLAVLPVKPDILSAIIRDMGLTGRWDHWVDRTKGSGSDASGRLLLKYNYTVTTKTSRQGNIRIIHFHLKPKSGSDLKAYTRTVRLIPVKNAKDPHTGKTVSRGTLIMMDEHFDFNGDDTKLPFPRTRIPIKPRITWGGFLNGFLRTIQPPTSVITRHAMNRFAVSAGNLLSLAQNPKISADALRKQLAYDSSRANQTETVRHIDFLSLSQNKDTQQWVLKIDKTARSNDVRPYFTSLGIPGPKITEWVTKGEVLLEDVRKATGLDQHLGAASFRALAHATLSPSSSQFGSSTERYFLTLAHLKKRAKSLETQSGKNLKGDIIVFQDNRFHPKISQVSRRQGDTVDSLGFYYVPGTISWKGKNIRLDIDKFIGTIHHTEDYDRIDPANFGRADIVNSPALTPPAKVDPNRVYTSSRIDLPGGLKLNYVISGDKQASVLHGGRLSSWRLEPAKGLTDFSDNTGWWLIIPAKKGGYFVLRAGILNSKSGSDNTGTVAETGRKGVVDFMEGLVSSSLEHQRGGKRTAWTTSMGRALNYSVGQVVNEKGQAVK